MPQQTIFPKQRIQFLNNALLIDSKILVIADLHIGQEEIIIKQGLAPRTQLHNIITNLNKIFNSLEKRKINLNKIIILGDLKHEHGKISNEEWRETLYFLDIISKKAKNIILIKGNHDNILQPIINKRNLEIKPYYKYKDILFMHGHKEYKQPFQKGLTQTKKSKIKNFKTIILSHIHPAITLTDNYKREKYKCFLKGKYKSKQTYILPSFNPISTGYDLTNPKNLYPIKKDFFIIPENKLKNFNVLIYNKKEQKVYDFGKLKGLI